MALFLLFLLFYSEESSWTENTGIYHIISSKAAAFHKDYGRLYLLDTKEQEIIIYDEHLRFHSRFGGKGQGPGKFNYAFGLIIESDHIYILGRQFLHTFDSDGSFENRWRIPSEISSMSYHRVLNGWVGMSTGHFQHPELPIKLIYYTDDFQESKVLGTWKRYPIKASLKENIEFYNPAEKSIALQVSLDKRYIAFLTQIPDDRVFVYDSQYIEQKPIIIKPNWPKVPLDKDWAMKQLRKYAPKAKPIFHDHFPVIEAIMGNYSSKNNLVIKRYNPYKEREEDFTEYQWTGEPVKRSLKKPSAFRIVAEHGEWLFVRNIIDEEHVIQKVRHADLDQFHAENPYSGQPHIVTPPFGD